MHWLVHGDVIQYDGGEIDEIKIGGEVMYTVDASLGSCMGRDGHR